MKGSTPVPIALAEHIAIGPDVTAGELHDALAPIGADLMVRALSALERGALALTPQPTSGVTYAAKIANAETRIDWDKPWKTVHDHIRGLSPFPGAWFELPDGARAKVLRTTRGEGSGAARHGARRSAHRRLRRGRGAHPRAAARRQAGHEGWGFSARHADCARRGHALRATRDAALQTPDRV